MIQGAYAARLVATAQTVLADFDSIRFMPKTIVFLTALLHAGRWSWRG